MFDAPTSLILGPPGCGKTTELLRQVEVLLSGGIEPDRIAYLAFTRRAAEEAISRASKRFGISREDLPYFRTIHSLAYRQLGVTQEQMFSSAHLREFADIMKLDVRSKVSVEEGTAWGAATGDTLLFHENLARGTDTPLKQIWRQANAEYPFSDLERVRRGLQIFKSTRKLLDFTDLLSVSAAEATWPRIDTLFVDEGQDLSALQWGCVREQAKVANHVVIAGDDDQAIYRWAGADLSTFTSLGGRPKVLDRSYRVPRKAQQLASSIIKRIRGPRFEKSWKPRDAEGTVEYCFAPEEVDLGSGQWLVLARNNFMLGGIADHCRRSGWLFGTKTEPDGTRYAGAIAAWRDLCMGREVAHADALAVFNCLKSGEQGVRRPGKSRLLGELASDTFTMQDLRANFCLDADGDWFDAFRRVPLIEREYLRSCERAGESLEKEPRIRLQTIHGSKGGEADNVLLLTDMSRKTFEGLQTDPDDEIRTFYVGVTRAKEKLTICEPRTRYSFQI